MTWTNADVPLVERTALAADKPILIGGNALDRPVIVGQWRNDAAPSMYFGDRNAPDREGSRVYSRAGTPRSRPSFADTLWWILFELAYNASASVVFDTLVLLNHNLHTITDLTARLDIANSHDYSSGLVSLTPDFAVPGPRYVRYHLGTGGTPQRYTGSGYGRIRLTAPSAFVPEIAGVWLSQRRQLRKGPDVPHDPLATTSRTSTSSDVNGSPNVVMLYQGKRALRAVIEPDDTEETLQDTTTIRAWHLECRHGSAPFLWIPRPSSAPYAVELHQLRRPGLHLPLEGATQRHVRIEADELPPFINSEAA